MRKKSNHKKFGGRFLACMLAAVLAVAVHPAQRVSATGADTAQIPAVSYYGRAGQFVFTPGTGENPADLFRMFKGMVPGDTREQEITLRSAAASGAPINLFLRAYVPAPGADATEKEKEDAAKAEALLQRMTIRISCDEFSDRPMLSAGAYPDQGMGEWVFLGRFAYNTTSILRVKVQMPTELAVSGNDNYTDNDFQGVEAKVRWAFLVEEFDDTTPGGGGGNPNPEPENPTPVNPTPVPTPGGGGATGAGPEAEAGVIEGPPEMEALEDLPTPLAPPADEELGLQEEEVPLAGLADSSAWALVNFILMNLAIFESVMLLIGYFVDTKDEGKEEEKRKLNKKLIFRVISLPIAVLSLVVFLLTEDLAQPVTAVDKYTLVMALIAIVQTVMVALSRKKYEDREEAEV